jgi:uncharacterized membrane protein YjjB (DUF3815 family)
MAADTGMKLVLFAGTLTFGNEWLQSHEINWRIPVATVIAAAAVGAVGSISPNGGTSLGVMALIVAAATPLNGKSPIQQIDSVVNAKSTAASQQKVS